ncbi:hypothetical protein BCR34DRAFT_184774 [Clohesyomyces aquaticus]|uniref:Uncharacterized protein n=1 Tax=Clohesyomyces aquaticus TaxID=1231657 RepID=A0A1Y1YEU1_9PLEO|nr:hypothetical protein BCR34DRAFT_184774 [Clohesyomyces aquaticus]
MAAGVVVVVRQDDGKQRRNCQRQRQRPFAADIPLRDIGGKRARPPVLFHESCGAPRPGRVLQHRRRMSWPHRPATRCCSPTHARFRPCAARGRASSPCFQLPKRRRCQRRSTRPPTTHSRRFILRSRRRHSRPWLASPAGPFCGRPPLLASPFAPPSPACLSERVTSVLLRIVTAAAQRCARAARSQSAKQTGDVVFRARWAPGPCFDALSKSSKHSRICSRRCQICCTPKCRVPLAQRGRQRNRCFPLHLSLRR